MRPSEHPRGELSAGIGRGSAREVETLVADLTYHLPLDRHWSAGARVAAYSFESSESGALDSDFGELEAARTTSGSGAGLGAELRFYPAGAHDGLWIGAGALYFPYSETESVGVAREPATGATFRSELESDAIELVGYGTLGWTLRGAGRSTWSAGLEAGSASGETFASLTLRFGFRF